MMPTFSGAMQTLRHAAIARASTTLNINQQVGASIGTAVLSVLLVNALASKRAARAASAPPPRSRPRCARIARPMAEAFGSTFWWALGLVAIAFVVALALLPKEKPEPVHDPDAPEGEAPEAPALALAMAG